MEMQSIRKPVAAEQCVVGAALREFTALDAGADRTESSPTPSLSARSRVLLVEQDVPLTRFLSRGMGSEFAVSVVHDGETALDALAEAQFDLVILDLNQPRVDGMVLLEQVRLALPQLPVVVLTARSKALVAALEAGADDFLLKPFSFTELVARVRAVLRRSTRTAARTERTIDTGAGIQPNPPPSPASNCFKFRDLFVNREEYRVERGCRAVDLTPREFSILETLIAHAGRPVTRATLMEQVWKAPLTPASNIVDVYMKYLRDKIDGDGEEKLIRTIRGVGYVLGGREHAPKLPGRPAELSA